MWLPTMSDLEKALTFADDLQNPKTGGVIAEAFDVLRRGRPSFLVFGPGGMGKTALKCFLETFSSDESPIEYNMSCRREKGKLKGRRYSDVYVYPGQPDFRDPQIDLYKRSIAKARRPIITTVVSYGYRSVDPNSGNFRDAPQGPQARDEELDYTRKMLGTIRNIASYKRWTVFSVIAKADLWWDERTDVDAFYANQYQPIIDDFRGRVGTDKSEHYILPISLPRTPLLDVNGAIIQRSSQDYDDSLKRKHIGFFIKTLRDVLEE